MLKLVAIDNVPTALAQCSVTYMYGTRTAAFASGAGFAVML